MEPLVSLAIINNTVAECKEGPFCSNGPSNNLQPRCPDCRLSSNAYHGATRHYWKPISHTYSHPVLNKEKRDAKYAKAAAKAAANKAKDRSKQALLRKSERVERKTNDRIIKATKNSGRVNRDGDHLLNNHIVVDTKLQSNAKNPRINLHELDKVRADAKRAGQPYGVLCIQNSTGRSVIVCDQADFAALTKS